MFDQARQFVDRDLSLMKFDREISEFRADEAQLRNQGCFLVSASWPMATVLILPPKAYPLSIPIAVQFDYTNYDATPPSVRIVNPFTGRLLMMREILIQLLYRMSPSGSSVGNYLQAVSADDVPFLCVRGVREYHDHPLHSGDPWDLYRASGGGGLMRITNIILRHGIDATQGIQIAFSSGQVDVRPMPPNVSDIP